MACSSIASIAETSACERCLRSILSHYRIINLLKENSFLLLSRLAWSMGWANDLRCSFRLRGIPDPNKEKIFIRIDIWMISMSFANLLSNYRCMLEVSFNENGSPSSILEPTDISALLTGPSAPRKFSIGGSEQDAIQLPGLPSGYADIRLVPDSIVCRLLNPAMNNWDGSSTLASIASTYSHAKSTTTLPVASNVQGKGPRKEGILVSASEANSSLEAVTAEVALQNGNGQYILKLSFSRNSVLYS